jgi:hypothetical protein
MVRVWLCFSVCCGICADISPSHPLSWWSACHPGSATHVSARQQRLSPPGMTLAATDPLTYLFLFSLSFQLRYRLPLDNIKHLTGGLPHDRAEQPGREG